MPTGAPDFTEVVWIMAQDAAGNLRPVAVDAAGQLVTAIKGNIDGITAPVSVDQVTKDREVKGTDGVALRTLAVDANGQLIMVPRGQTGNYMDVDAAGNLSTVIKGLEGANLRTVAVDATGNIIGVFKGEHAGALKTIATDADGRMLAVLTDPENIWGDRPIIGQAELAVRLGSPVAYEQRGSVIFKDSFEHGFTNFRIHHGGDGSSVRLTSEFSRHGGYSAKLTAAGVIPSDPSLDTEIYALDLSVPIGVEFSFTLPPSGWDMLILLFHVFTGTEHFALGFKFRFFQGDTQINTDLGWVTIPGSKDTLRRGQYFNTAKIVVNPATKKYLRLYQAGLFFDLSTYSFPVSSSRSQPYIVAYIKNRGIIGEASTIYIDSIIVTTHEPLI